MCYMAFDESTLNGKMLQIKKKKWILDSGYSRHMTRDPEILNDINYDDDGLVNFGDNSKGYVIGIGNVGNSKTPIISDILLVRNLKHNLLSISQLRDFQSRPNQTISFFYFIRMNFTTMKIDRVEKY